MVGVVEPGQRVEAGEGVVAAIRVEHDRHDPRRERAHRVRPRAASSAEAVSTRSTAVWVRSHAISSSMPASKVTVGAKPSSRRALPMSAKQNRMSPARYCWLICGRDVHAELADEGLGHVQHADAPPGAEVDRLVVGGVGLERQQQALHDVLDVDEVAALAAVLEDHRRLAVQQPAAEDGGHAGVGVGQRLARPVDVEEAEGDGGDAVGPAHRQAHLLLVALRHRVDRGRAQRLLLVGRQRRQPVDERIEAVPVALLQRALAAQHRVDHLAAGRAVGALAVNRHRRGDDQLARPVPPVGEDLEQVRRAHRVGVHVLGDLVHGLADADLGRQVIDDLAAGQRVFPDLGIADVAAPGVDPGRHPRGPGRVGAVHLWHQRVEDADVVSPRNQRIDQMRPDEPRPARDQNPHARPPPADVTHQLT